MAHCPQLTRRGMKLAAVRPMRPIALLSEGQ
jgi:hypothetical protein